MCTYPTKASVVVALALFAAACNTTPVYKKAATVLRSEAYKSSTTEALFAAPWPDDRQLNPDGTVSFLKFPKARATGLFDNVVNTAEGQVHGFGLQTPLYVPLPTPLLDSSLDDQSLSLVVIDPKSPRFGERAVIEWRQLTTATLYFPGPTLQVRPKPGFPLEPATKYALIVTTRVKNRTGEPIGPDEPLFNALHGQAKTEKEKKTLAFFAPLRSYLDREKIPVADIATALVFTTQPIGDELLNLAAFLQAQPDPTPVVTAHASDTATYDVFEGSYPAPFLQHGTPPFDLEGGDFRYDSDGKPLIARSEDMRFVVTIPKGEVPVGGFPVVLYAHGTGGNYKSVLGGEAQHLAAKGIAAVGIDQVLHGPRVPPDTTCFGNDVEICFYNPINVVAGRNNARQAALDNVSLQKMLAHLQIPASLDPTGRTIALRTNHYGFFGHSQGGLTGAIYATFAEDVDGFVLSGNGGWLTHTILIRTDPIDLKTLAESALLLNMAGVESLDEYHPVLAMLQTLAEEVDPNNFARWFKGRTHPQSVYATSGLDDPFTPALGASMTAALAGLVPYAPILRDEELFTGHGLVAQSAPITANLSATTTGVFRQFVGYGHYAAFDSEAAIANWQEFFDDVMHGRVPTIH